MKTPRLASEKKLWGLYGKELLERIFQSPDGARIGFYVFGGTTSPVIIFPLTPDDKVVAVRQFRYGANDIVLEIPGGIISPGDTPEQAVRKELLEETGYAPVKIVQMGKPIWFEPSALKTAFFPYLVLGCQKEKDPNPENTEFMETVLVPLEEWLKMIWTGEVRDSKTLAVTLLALHHLGRI